MSPCSPETFLTLDLSLFLHPPFPNDPGYPSPAQRDAACLLHRCLSNVGLLFVKNLALSPQMLSQMYDQSANLFAPSEAEKKSKLPPMLPDTNIGYLPHNIEGLNTARGVDIKETFNFKFAGEIPDLSGTPDGFSDTALAFWNAVLASANAFCSAADLALDVPSGTMANLLGRNQMTAIRLLHYPPYSANDVAAKRTGPDAVRAGEHRDFGLFTFLFTDAPGLQAHVHGQWLDVPLVPKGTSIVVVGGLMARWTNDLWPAVLHRVIVHDDSEKLLDRTSIACFFQPDADFIVSTPQKFFVGGKSKYEPVSSDIFLNNHLTRINGSVTKKAYYS